MTGSPASSLPPPPPPSRRVAVRLECPHNWLGWLMAPRNRAGRAGAEKRRLNADPTGYAGGHGGMRRPTDGVPPGVFAKARALPGAFAGDEREATEPAPAAAPNDALGAPTARVPVDIAVAAGSARVRVAWRAVVERADGIGARLRTVIDIDLPTPPRRSLSFAAWHAWDAAPVSVLSGAVGR